MCEGCEIVFFRWLILGKLLSLGFFVCLVGLGKMIKWNRWNESSSNHWAMYSMKVMDISTMSQSASQGKSSVVNGSFKFICEVKWKISLGTKVGQRAVKNHLSNTYEKEGI